MLWQIPTHIYRSSSIVNSSCHNFELSFVGSKELSRGIFKALLTTVFILLKAIVFNVYTNAQKSL